MEIKQDGGQEGQLQGATSDVVQNAVQNIDVVSGSN